MCNVSYIHVTKYPKFLLSYTGMMGNDELVLHLLEFGIPKSESELYVGLLNTGPTRASYVCNVVHMNRVKGYKILENLKTLGLVSSTFSSPAMYKANELKESLENLLSMKKFDIDRLEKIADTIIENYKVTKTSEISEDSNPQFTLISGRQNIFSRIEKMIREETKEIWMVTTYNDLSMMYYTSIPECIIKSQKKGVMTKVITELEKEKSSEIIDRMKIEDLRIANLPSKGRIVCNSSETLISGYTTKKSNLNALEDSAFLTDSEEFVSNMKCLANQLWKSGINLYSKSKKELRV